MKELLHTGDVVRHRQSGRIGKVTGFAHDGTTDVCVDGTGPYPQADLDRMVQEKTQADPLVEAIRRAIPSLRTQAQYETFLTALGALQEAAEGICAQDEVKAAKGRELLQSTLTALAGVTATCEKLREVPEAATSPASEAFKRPPPQFEELPLQERLLAELATIGDSERFLLWYTASRPELDRVVSPILRNPLFDAIRAHKLRLQCQ